MSVSDTGFELRSNAQCETAILSTSAANSDAVDFSSLRVSFRPGQTEAESVSLARLSMISELWPMIPSDVQAELVARARLAAGADLARNSK